MNTELTQLAGFADAITQEVQLGPADFATPLNLHVNNVGRVDHECSLNALIGNDTPNGKDLVNPAPAPRNHHTVEDLYALLLALNDSRVYVDGITDVQRGNFGLAVRLFNEFYKWLGHR